MMWRKEFGFYYLKNQDFLLMVIIAFITIGIFIKHPVLYSIIGIFTTYLLINRHYDKTMGNKLMLKNDRITIRVFPDEEANLQFEFKNRGLLPMINGQLTFQTDPSIQALNHVASVYTYWNELSMPLSIIGKGITRINVPIKSKQRGTATVNNITYTFPHLFNFENVTLTFSPRYETEIIVYPTLIPVKGIETAFHMTPGVQRVNHSPFEDVQSSLGTRDYTYSDPFHRINWKASAKTHYLQTNVYEKVVDISYVFMVNIELKRGSNMAKFNQRMEKLLSYAAYLSQFATEKGIAYEMWINSRKPGSIPYLHLPEGEGNIHYGQTLEMLARIKRQTLVVPFGQIVHQVGQKFSNPKTIIILGEITAETSKILSQWKRRQHHVFHVSSTNDNAEMKHWVDEVMHDAT